MTRVAARLLFWTLAASVEIAIFLIDRYDRSASLRLRLAAVRDLSVSHR